jgi:nucleotidyltransferase/DNA polymerase involved in DNA repair
LSKIGTLKEDTKDKKVIFEKIMELSNELNQKIKRDNVSFRTVSLITIDIELKTHIKSETISRANDIQRAIPVFKQLLDNYIEENPEKKLRRIGIRVSNLEFFNSQRTLDEF